MIDKWDTDGRYKKLVLALVKQCEDEGLTVEEAKYALTLTIGEINRQGNFAKVKSECTIQKYKEDARKFENRRRASH